MQTVSSFPHTNKAEFDQACNCLLAKFEQNRHLQHEWLSVDILPQYDDAKYLRITGPLPNAQPQGTPANNPTGFDAEEIGIEEHDEEALDHSKALKSQPVVLYDVVLSPTYQLPVLYIDIRDTHHRFPPTMSTLYNHLVTPHFKTQAENVGVIGGITISDHPVSNRPVFFIHPCQTAEVLEASVDKKQVKLDEYLTLWVGAMGRCVGLNVPVALAKTNA